MAVKMKPNSAYFLHVNSFPAKTHKGFKLRLKTTHHAYDTISVVLTLQEKIIPPKITQNTIDYNNTVSLLSFINATDYIYCKYIIYCF